MQEINKDKLKEGLKNLCTSIKNSAVEQAKENVLYPQIEKIFNSTDYNAEHIGLYLYHQIELIIESLLYDKYKTANSTVVGIYSDWRLYDEIITKICQDLYGHCCCADKSRYVLKSYIRNKTTEDIIDWNQDNYWIPKTGTKELWFELIEAITKLKYGYYKHFLVTLNKFFDEIRTVSDEH
jgi:hypothetical protein